MYGILCTVFRLNAWEKKTKIDFENGFHGGHLGCGIKYILGNFGLLASIKRSAK